MLVWLELAPKLWHSYAQLNSFIVRSDSVSDGGLLFTPFLFTFQQVAQQRPSLGPHISLSPSVVPLLSIISPFTAVSM